MPRSPRRPGSAARPHVAPAEASELRIVGGTFRGRRLRYSGDARTRPMKDRVREAVFNLVGPAVVGSEAIDLFAGTGALGLEAISRGAASAIFVEQHRPTAALIRQNIAGLEVEVPVEVVAADTFYWYRHQAQLGGRPWLVLCSPPFDFFVERRDALLELVQYFVLHAPPGSVVVVESDERFDPADLPRAGEWLVRRYPPAVVAVLRLPREAAEAGNLAPPC